MVLLFFLVLIIQKGDFTMINDDEMLLFINHIYLLVTECKKCQDHEMKTMIVDEILFFGDLLEQK